MHSSVNGVEITISRQHLSNLLIRDYGNTYYLNYYDDLHNINLDKTAVYKFVCGLLAIEFTHSIQKNTVHP